jgi:hypothetical protein
MTNLSLLTVKNFKNLKRVHLTFNDSNMMDVLMGFLTSSLPEMSMMEHLDINIFEYVAGEVINGAVIRFLNGLREVKNLRELYFSVDGDLNYEFSSEMVTSLTKCSQIRTLGTFSLKTTVTLLLHLFSKLSRMKNLEALMIWFSPLEGSLTQNYSVFSGSIFDAIVQSIGGLRLLEYINLRFPYSYFSKLELATLGTRLKALNRKLSAKVGVIPPEHVGDLLV